MTIVWILGSSGLLGTALCKVLQRSDVILFTPAERFCWNDERDLIVQLETAVRAFAAFVGNENDWQIYWAAGIGTMSSKETELAIETRVLSKLLSLIGFYPELMAKNGGIAFASSAGAIYAGATDDIITENTLEAPTTAYAREKLKQENLLGTFAVTYTNMRVLLARISTLYGPGQATGKQQGLLAEIARRILRNQPIQIFVPFDTIRDYIAVDDAATRMITALNSIRNNPGVFIKIIASEQPTSIAEIISIYKRITRRVPRIVTSASRLSSIYTQRIQFHSIAILANEPTGRTSLLVGISQIMAAERIAFARSGI
jgi:UDP-glucose 4-epimerase